MEHDVATLTGDGLHHCATLVFEKSLQKYGLSDLNEKGIITFLHYFCSYLCLCLY